MTTSAGDPVPEAEVRPGFRRRLPASVWALGLASFFNDVGSDMSFPILPAFLLSLGATPIFLGLVEGLADATSALLKVLTGYAVDRGWRAKPLVLAGYGLAGLARPLLAFARVPAHVLAVRVTDRIGKGTRTAPRDLLISRAVPPEDIGRAFGLHRAMDHAGAVVGPLLATTLLALGLSVRNVFLVAIVPSVLALFAVASVREPRVEPAPAPDVPRSKEPLSPRLRRYLGIVAVLSLASSSDAFLLLRAGELGFSTTTLPLLWVVLHLSKAAATVVGGRLADRHSRARLIAAGLVVFAVCYTGLGFATDAWQVWALFALYGLHAGLTEPAERALVRDLAPLAIRGRAYGWFHGIFGACAIPAGLMTGALWNAWGSAVALSTCAGLALVAAGLLLRWDARERP